MTAGVLVCSMPSTAVVLGHFQGPVSSFITKSRKGFSSFFTSISISHHEKLDSTSNLRPSKGDSSRQDRDQGQYEMQEPWPGAEDAWVEVPAESDTTAAVPFEDARIRKSTKIEVTRASASAGTYTAATREFVR